MTDYEVQPIDADAGDRAQKGPAMQIPYGLREGRMFGPEVVARGLACGCVCPACHGPLVAKQGESGRRRPHFAHHVGADCHAGFETSLHLKAKEVLVEAGWLWLPGWNGSERMPNPPQISSKFGKTFMGEAVEWPAARADLRSADAEVALAGCRADVLAVDQFGELLIEVRVTHAVDAGKQARVRAAGLRMIEIDLSSLPRDVAFDEVRLRAAILDELANKTWLCLPDAEAKWAEAHASLQAKARESDREEESRRRAFEEARAKVVAEEAQRHARREEARRRVRTQYADDLELLAEFAQPAAIGERSQEFEARDRCEALELVASFDDPQLTDILTSNHLDAWVYEADPVLWQAAVFQEFVADREIGFVVKQPEVARWVIRNFGIEQAMYRLFRAQYTARQEARRAGYEAWRLAHWAFTDLENTLIPNYFKPINWLMDRLVVAGYLARQAKGMDLVVLQRAGSA